MWWRIWLAVMILFVGAFALIPALGRHDAIGSWAMWTIILWVIFIVGLVLDRYSGIFGLIAILAFIPAILMTGMMAFAPAGS